MKITASELVHAPVESVFDVYTDIARAAERISGIQEIEILGEVQRGLGVRWRETRVMLGKAATEEMEITRFDENRGYVVEAESNGTHYTSTFRFEEVDASSTRVHWEFVAEPLSFGAKLLSPLGLLFKGSLKKILLGDMTDLKKHIEDTTSSAAGQS